MLTWVSSPQHPALADIYTEHAHQVVVAKYAPSGFYIASGGTCVRARVDGRGGPGLGRAPAWEAAGRSEVGVEGSGMAGGTTVLSFVWGRQEDV